MSLSKLHYNPDIDSFFNELPGALGLKGQCFDGMPQSAPGDDSERLSRIERAIPAVSRWRKLSSIFSRMPHTHQVQLRHRYRVSEREHSQIVGLQATFSDLKCLAWHLCEDKEKMRDTLSRGVSSKRPEVEALRELTERVNREIHKSWIEAERSLYQEWANK